MFLGTRFSVLWRLGVPVRVWPSPLGGRRQAYALAEQSKCGDEAGRGLRAPLSSRASRSLAHGPFSSPTLDHTSAAHPAPGHQHPVWGGAYSPDLWAPSVSRQPSAQAPQPGSPPGPKASQPVGSPGRSGPVAVGVRSSWCPS